ncbi:hypothetical protein J4462_04465 [Candidatus Pacearchaeota archaeon]|nr:hypothetical protein [Candidatus Pacearchaeota archaeon]
MTIEKLLGQSENRKNIEVVELTNEQLELALKDYELWQKLSMPLWNFEYSFHIDENARSYMVQNNHEQTRFVKVAPLSIYVNDRDLKTLRIETNEARGHRNVNEVYVGMEFRHMAL